MRVGIVGCGTIGRTIVESLRDFAPVERLLLYDHVDARAREAAALNPKASVAASLDEVIAQSDFVVEAASQAGAREVAPRALSAGKDLLLMSLGALSDDAFWNDLRAKAESSPGRLYLPSGALGGLEAVVAGSQAGLEEAVLTTRKPPAALKGVKYLEERGIHLGKITKPLLVFDGSAREAVRLFPANINVAAALSLAGLGFDRTRVRIIADPASKTNRHHVRVRGAFGELECEVANVPAPGNPKTSYLAALSAVATVKNAARHIHFGP